MNKRQHLHWKVSATKPYSLNLDPDFKPHADSVEISLKKFSFPGGDQHLQLQNDPEPSASLIITQRVKNGSDMIDILLAVDAARRVGFKDIHLVLPCFPAARQDRVCNAGEPLTVKVFADLINGCKFESVTIYSPHSDVTPALIDNVIIEDFDWHFVKEIVQREVSPVNGKINIVCPDAGAAKRVLHLVQALNGASMFRGKDVFNMVNCEKKRDVTDGKILSIDVHAEDLAGVDCIVVDDVVAYGGTFLGIAEQLRAKNAGKIGIFTSHADCQAGLDKLATAFDFVYTTNSKADWQESDKIKVLPFEV